ncbi:MAG: hypothetical protein HY719_17075 [Planctomycetes bacterium]|nr:hypothetical protein [Planctomycetota bacterium]
MTRRRPESKEHRHQRAARLRLLLAREAARLIYAGEARDYADAKDRAARAAGVDPHGAAGLFPANEEVQMELAALGYALEGDARFDRLTALRRRALAIMESLASFEPRLAGAVLSGGIAREPVITVKTVARDIGVVAAALARAGHVAFIDGAALAGDDGAVVLGSLMLDTEPRARVVVLARHARPAARLRAPEGAGDNLPREVDLAGLRAILPADPAEPGEDLWTAMAR